MRHAAVVIIQSQNGSGFNVFNEQCKNVKGSMLITVERFKIQNFKPSKTEMDEGDTYIIKILLKIFNELCK